MTGQNLIHGGSCAGSAFYKSIILCSMRAFFFEGSYTGRRSKSVCNIVHCSSDLHVSPVRSTGVVAAALSITVGLAHPVDRRAQPLHLSILSDRVRIAIAVTKGAAVLESYGSIDVSSHGSDRRSALPSPGRSCRNLQRCLWFTQD